MGSSTSKFRLSNAFIGEKLSLRIFNLNVYCRYALAICSPQLIYRLIFRVFEVVRLGLFFFVLLASSLTESDVLNGLLYWFFVALILSSRING